MWQEIEAHIEENEREQVVPLRNAFLSLLRDSDMRPG